MQYFAWLSLQVFFAIQIEGSYTVLKNLLNPRNSLNYHVRNFCDVIDPPVAKNDLQSNWIVLGWPLSMLKLLSLCKPLWWFICKGSSTEMNSWKFKIWNDVNCSYVILKFLFEFFVFCKLYFSLGQSLGRPYIKIFC